MLTDKPVEGGKGGQALLCIITAGQQAQHDTHHWGSRNQGGSLCLRSQTLHQCEHQSYAERYRDNKLLLVFVFQGLQPCLHQSYVTNQPDAAHMCPPAIHD